MSMRISLFAAFLATALLIPNWASGQEGMVRTFDVEPGQTLVFDMHSGGSLSIEGWDRNTAEVSYGDGFANLDDFDIRIRASGKGLEIVGERQHHRKNNYSPHFEVKVPHKFNLDFETNGGGLTLTDLEGNFKGKTMGGALRLSNVNGVVQLKTMGGRIEVSDCAIDGKISTGGGSVLVENVVGDFRASSGGGDVRYINVRGKDGTLQTPGRSINAPISGKTILITRAGGGIDITEAPEGASLRTGGGDISVRGASKFVDAWTGGGDVDIRIDRGWVEVFTGAGDIDVTVDDSDPKVRGDIKIFTGTGDVSLTVPRGFSMELDLDLGYTRSGDRNFKISSNLDFDEVIADDWDSSQGTPRKHIYGTGSLNGGRNRIQIQTTNGSIRLFEER